MTYTLEELRLKVAICDDNPKITEELNKMLFDYNPYLFDTYTYYNPLKLLNHFQEENFDFFILDIEMDEMSGIDLAKKIREQGVFSPIVFLTSYKEYMEDVFQVQTFDYLLKPLTKERLTQVLDKLKRHLVTSEKYFIFSLNKVTHKIPTKNIVFFEKDKRQVIIHTSEETYKPYMTTDDVQEQLGNEFVQIHASFIINCSFIKELGRNFILIKHKSEYIELPISRRFKVTSHENIIMYMRGKI